MKMPQQHRAVVNVPSVRNTSDVEQTWLQLSLESVHCHVTVISLWCFTMTMTMTMMKMMISSVADFKHVALLTTTTTHTHTHTYILIFHHSFSGGRKAFDTLCTSGWHKNERTINTNREWTDECEQRWDADCRCSRPTYVRPLPSSRSRWPLTVHAVAGTVHWSHSAAASYCNCDQRRGHDSQ